MDTNENASKNPKAEDTAADHHETSPKRSYPGPQEATETIIQLLAMDLWQQMSRNTDTGEEKKKMDLNTRAAITDMLARSNSNTDADGQQKENDIMEEYDCPEHCEFRSRIREYKQYEKDRLGQYQKLVGVNEPAISSLVFRHFLNGRTEDDVLKWSGEIPGCHFCQKEGSRLFLRLALFVAMDFRSFSLRQARGAGQSSAQDQL
ncbi:hypothetical protein QBC41DRAFT_305873 [Cercophora samala]|uniref:Uncharacterized protein n=1 Tax=Cercophora samala TaxID=330535 RepID=A0AA40D8K3_9PEZI|nr:hypothetical protein QBC41DRAFT_305873 [Cercophora samala]